ncbi:MAG TPA: hypothetical protein VFE32_04510 [Puia sp.]|jgi:hypothetical protein|nr:hypothetical protein [Puia sp.]
MKRLSLWLSTAFAVLALSGAAFMKKPAPPSAADAASAPSSPTTKSANINYYYWYSAFDGSYNDYEPTSWEIYEMEIYYDVYVDTNPSGGTLIEKGIPYQNPNWPPMVYLYGHWD